MAARQLLNEREITPRLSPRHHSPWLPHTMHLLLDWPTATSASTPRRLTRLTGAFVTDLDDRHWPDVRVTDWARRSALNVLTVARGTHHFPSHFSHVRPMAAREHEHTGQVTNGAPGGSHGLLESSHSPIPGCRRHMSKSMSQLGETLASSSQLTWVMFGLIIS